jgi:hypothetical protein
MNKLRGSSGRLLADDQVIADDLSKEIRYLRLVCWQSCMRAGGTLRLQGGTVHALACRGLALCAAGAYLGARQKESRSFERLCLCAGAGVSPSSSATYACAARRQ